jgi:NAD-reducing hydrogenase small subunit
MSLLDLDERLLELAPRMDLVYSPLVDAKEFPPGVDVCLVEGAVASEEHAALLRRARERAGLLVALGDCAASGNVTAMRDAAGGVPAVLRCAWPGVAQRDPSLPALLDSVQPIGEVVEVDLFLPGCPPPADLIYFALAELLSGRFPDLDGQLRFG